MASRDDLENKKDILQLSRRRAFVWAGQVAAGLSLAGAGLGFLGARPLPAMAANQAGQAAAGSVKPAVSLARRMGHFTLNRANWTPTAYLAHTSS